MTSTGTAGRPIPRRPRPDQAERSHTATHWEQACDELTEPTHVVRFGTQVHVKGILGGTDEAARHIGYLTKY